MKKVGLAFVVGVLFLALLTACYPPVVETPVVDEAGMRGVAGPVTFRSVRVENDLLVDDDLTVAGAATLTTLDLNGNALTLDADADTTMTADTDDQVDLALGGADLFVFQDFGASAITTDTTINLLEIIDASPVMTGGTNSLAGLNVDLGIGNSTGGTNSVYGVLVDGISQDAQNTEIGVQVGSGWDYAADLDGAVKIDGGLVYIGGGTYATANGDNDLGVAGDLEVDGAIDADGALTVAGVTSLAVGTEHIGIPSVVTVAITYTAGAGGTGTVATITDGEIWFVHAVFVQTTTSFDATGDDATLTVGDGNDADGFLALADASLQSGFTEDTGFAAGWAGIENGSAGAYTTDDGGPFVYAPSGADETIDWATAAAGDDLSAGAATIYVYYTRIQ